MNLRNKAFTLIEVVIGVVLASLILIGVLNLLSSGMKGSTNALTHQDNMETANILMRQIEYDFLKATDIEFPPKNTLERTAKWSSSFRESNKDVNITYLYTLNSGVANGINRDIAFDGGSPKSFTFAKGHPLDVRFTHYASETADFEKHALWVEIEVGSEKGKVASFTLSRLIELKKPF